MSLYESPKEGRKGSGRLLPSPSPTWDSIEVVDSIRRGVFWRFLSSHPTTGYTVYWSDWIWAENEGKITEDCLLEAPTGYNRATRGLQWKANLGAWYPA